jgi:hypothetical protein
MIRMTLHQSRYDLRAFLRNRQSQFFTLALPVLFLVIFASVFGGSGPLTRSRGPPSLLSARARAWLRSVMAMFTSMSCTWWSGSWNEHQSHPCALRAFRADP